LVPCPQTITSGHWVLFLIRRNEMKILNTSIVPKIGIQIIVSQKTNKNMKSGIILEGNKSWIRLQIVAKKLLKQINHKFIPLNRIDVQEFLGGYTELQFSYKHKTTEN